MRSDNIEATVATIVYLDAVVFNVIFLVLIKIDTKTIGDIATVVAGSVSLLKPIKYMVSPNNTKDHAPFFVTK